MAQSTQGKWHRHPLLAALVGSLAGVAATVVALFAGDQADIINIYVGPAPPAPTAVPEPSTTVTDTADPTSRSTTEPSRTVRSRLLADLDPFDRSLGGPDTDIVQVDGTSYPDTVQTYLSVCGDGGDRRSAAWQWDDDFARLTGLVGLTDDSFASAAVTLSVHAGNGDLLERYAVEYGEPKPIDVDLEGVHAVKVTAEGFGGDQPDCDSVTVALPNTELVGPD